MTLPQLKNETVERFEKEIGGGLNSNPAYKEQVKSFLLSEIEKIDKAYGGCHNCWGKGYSTVKQFASGQGESLMGQGDVSIHYELPNMRFCACERGKALKVETEKAYQAGRKKALEEVALEEIQKLTVNK